jgi:hypothetical protein
LSNLLIDTQHYSTLHTYHQVHVYPHYNYFFRPKDQVNIFLTEEYSTYTISTSTAASTNGRHAHSKMNDIFYVHVTMIVRYTPHITYKDNLKVRERERIQN